MKFFISFSTILGFTFCLFLNSSAQEIPIGTWRDHLSYNNSVSVTYGNNIVYCASESAIFSYDTKEKTIERLNLITGLSDIEITQIKYNTYNNKLIVAYKNGNIDVIDQNNKVTNLSFIKSKVKFGLSVTNSINSVSKILSDSL